MTGAELASELKKRKGKKPSPGTIYPLLKHMKESNLLLVDENKSYSLTKQGKQILEEHIQTFIKTFYDIDEMKCHRKNQNLEK